MTLPGSAAASPGAVDQEYLSKVDEASGWLAKNLPEGSLCGAIVIAGSGLGGFVRKISPVGKISFAEIPHVGPPTVAGHTGELLVGTLPHLAAPVLVFSGRRHLYEGLSAPETTLPLRAALLAFGSARRVVISNAAGGLNPQFQVGDLMIIRDQVNWTFRNPLIGKNPSAWGDRFPDLSNIYSKRLAAAAGKAGSDLGGTLREGIYVGLTGPSYETRAEIGMLRDLIGADAVGMSTVAEALVCAHAGRDVIGISFISNSHARPAVTTHQEVMDNARLVEQRFGALVEMILKTP
jgi:purine-nucleoside phosphorylase